MPRLTRCSGSHLLSPLRGAGWRISPLLGVPILVALAIGLSPAPASAQAGTCVQDEFNSFNASNKTLSCTANDVSIAGIQGFTIIRNGVGNKCVPGTTFDFVADFEIKTTSSKTRSNIGIFFGTGTGAGQNGALTGTCSDDILSPTFTCPGTGGAGQPPAVTCGDSGYKELDGPINGEPSTGSPIGCGDTTSADTSAFGPGTQAAEFEVTGVTCPTSGTTLSLPECTSWWQPTTTMPVCESPAPDYPWQPQAIPGTSSKCSCGTLSIPIQPIEPSVTVAKSCNTTLTTGSNKVSCDAGPEGSTVTYTVTITNATPAGEGGVIVDQICDNRYGNIFTASGFTPACPAGTVGSIVSGSASSCASLGTIANGGSASCTFQAVQGENASVTDQVTVSGHSSLSSISKFSGTTSNTVTVTSEDAPSTATTTKGLLPGPQAACVTLRYNVTASNTSSADEVLTLNSSGTAGSPGYVPALNDSSFGDITTTHGSASVSGSVVGTTCGVATSSSGLGTLSGSSGAGAFPQSLAVAGATGSSYQCEFDGVICGTPGSIVTTPGVCTGGVCSAGLPNTTSCTANSDCNVTCAEGLQNLDTVTANLTGDDLSPADVITQTEKQFTANVCLVQSGHN